MREAVTIYINMLKSDPYSQDRCMWLQCFLRDWGDLVFTKEEHEALRTALADVTYQDFHNAVMKIALGIQK